MMLETKSLLLKFGVFVLVKGEITIVTIVAFLCILGERISSTVTLKRILERMKASRRRAFCAAVHSVGLGLDND